MFRRLATLDVQSIEYRRQREVSIERCLPLADNIAGQKNAERAGRRFTYF